MSYSESFRTGLIRYSFYALVGGMIIKHFFSDMPYRAFLWNESLMRPLIELLPFITWSQYVSSNGVEELITPAQFILGTFLIVVLLGAFYFSQRKIYARLLYICGIYLFILSLFYTMYRSYQVGEFLEYFLRWTTPFLFLLLLKNEKGFLVRIATWACSATFIGHALYAIGFHPVPGNFVHMVITGFGFQDQAALNFLFVVGILDILAAVGIFINNGYIRIASLAWMIIWGFLTAFARIWVNVDFQEFWSEMLLWGPEFLIRFPHFLVPTFLLLNTRKE